MEQYLQMVSAISFGWFADFGKTLSIHYLTLVPTGLFWQMVSTPPPHSPSFHWIISDGVVNGIGRNGNVLILPTPIPSSL